MYIPRITDPITFSQSWLAFAPSPWRELYGPSPDLTVISIASSGVPVPHFTPPHHHTDNCYNVQCYGLSGEGSLLAIAYDNGDLEVRLTSTGKLLSAGPSGQSEGFCWLSFSQDGKYLVGELKGHEHSGSIRLYRPCIGLATGSLEPVPITTISDLLINIYFEGVLQSLVPLSNPDSLSLGPTSAPSVPHSLSIDLPFGRESYLRSSELHNTLDQSRSPSYFVISELVTAAAHLVGSEPEGAEVAWYYPPGVTNNGRSLVLLPHPFHHGQQWSANQPNHGSLRYKASLPTAGGVLVFGGRHDRRGNHLDITIVDFRNLQSVCNLCYSCDKPASDLLSHCRIRSKETPNLPPGGAKLVRSEVVLSLVCLCAATFALKY